MINASPEPKSTPCRWGCGATVYWVKDQKGRNALAMSLPSTGMRANLASDDLLKYRFVGTNDLDAKYIAHYPNCPRKPKRRTGKSEVPDERIGINEGGRPYQKRKKGSAWTR